MTIEIFALAMSAFFIAPNTVLAQMAPDMITDLTVSPTNSQCQMGKENLRADNISTLTEYVIVRNATGQPLPGKSVAALGEIDGMTITPGVVATDANGLAVFTIKSSKAGLANFLRVSVSGQQINCPQVKVVQCVDANNSTIETAVDNAPADNSTEISMTVYVRDGSNDPFIDYDPNVYLETNWTGKPEDVNMSPLSPQGATGGQVAFKIKSKGAGILTVTAKVDNVIFAKKATLTFTELVPVKMSDANSTVTKTSPLGAVLADDEHSASISVLVRDQNGKGMKGKNVTLVSPSYFVKVSAPQLTNDSGFAYFTVRSTITGNFAIGARVDETSLASKASVQFVKQTSLERSTFKVAPGSIKADGVESATAVVTVMDGDGNALSGKNVSISSTPKGVAVDAALVTTNEAGQASFKVWSSTPGTYMLKAAVESSLLTEQPTLVATGQSAAPPPTAASPAADATTGNANPTPAAPTASDRYSTFEAVPKLLSVGKVLSFILILKDTTAAPITGRTVQFMVTTNGVLKVSQVTTDAAGKGQLDIVVSQPGSVSTSILVDSARFVASATVVEGETATPPTAGQGTAQKPEKTTEPERPVFIVNVTSTVGTAAPGAQPAPSVPAYLPGKFVWNFALRKLTYQNPKTSTLLAMWDAKWAYGALRKQSMRVIDATLNKIPPSNSNSNSNTDVRKYYSGYVLSTANDQKRIWYVNPRDLKRYWFDGSAPSYEYLKRIAEQR